MVEEEAHGVAIVLSGAQFPNATTIH